MPIPDLPDKKLRQGPSDHSTTSINESSMTVGIADEYFYGMSEADIRATFGQMQSLGVNNVRVLVPWGDVFKVPPGDPLEFFFPPATLVSRSISSSTRPTRGACRCSAITATPYWGGQDGQGCLGCYGASPDPTKFAAFAGQVGGPLRRQGGRIRGMERASLCPGAHDRSCGYDVVEAGLFGDQDGQPGCAGRRRCTRRGDELDGHHDGRQDLRGRRG